MTDKAVLTITFDDGAASVYNLAYPILAKYSIPAICAVNTGTLNTEGFMTTAQCTNLQEMGWDIINHTENHLHLPAQTDAVIRAEYVNSRDWLHEHGFSRAKNYCVFPYNDYDANVMSIVKEEGCEFTFGINERVNGILIYDKYETSRSTMSGNTTATFISRIDNAIANKLHLGMYYHYIDQPEMGATSTPSTDFSDQIDYLKTQIDAGVIEVVSLYDYVNTYLQNGRAKINGTVTIL